MINIRDNQIKAVVFLLSFALSSLAWGSNCVAWADSSTPADAFDINGEVILHYESGLEWARCSVGQRYENEQCHGEADGYAYDDAVAAAEAFTLSGNQDWRLPTRTELRSIVETACYYPAINEALFPDTPHTGYWSSSVNVEDGRIWTVGFSNGFNLLDNISGYNRVRPVRTAQ